MKNITTIFYIPKERISKGYVRMDKEESNHLVRVLRFKVNDRFIVTDGEGFKSWALLEKADNNYALSKLIDDDLPGLSPELPIDIDVAVGIIRPSRFENMVEMLVHLGVKKIIPLITTYSEIQNIKRVSSNDYHERLNRIAISGMKSSLRSYLPEVTEPVDIIDFLKKNEYKNIFFGEAEGLPNIGNSHIKDSRLLILIGPEGGFSHREIETICDYKGFPVNLGRTRLRTETAAVTMTVKIMNELRLI